MSLDIRAASARGYGRERANPERQLHEMADRLRQVPAAWPEPESPLLIAITVGDGNTIWSSGGASVTGCEYVNVTAVPTLAPAPGATPSGLARGNLVTSGAEVWVALWALGVAGYFGGPLPTGHVFLAIGPTALPITGSSPVAYAPVYLPVAV